MLLLFAAVAFSPSLAQAQEPAVCSGGCFGKEDLPYGRCLVSGTGEVFMLDAMRIDVGTGAATPYVSFQDEYGAHSVGVYYDTQRHLDVENRLDFQVPVDYVEQVFVRPVDANSGVSGGTTPSSFTIRVRGFDSLGSIVFDEDWTYTYGVSNDGMLFKISNGTVVANSVHRMIIELSNTHSPQGVVKVLVRAWCKVCAQE